MDKLMWTHKGINIEFHGEEFTAKVNGTTLKAPSLDAIRKKIANALLVEFKPFKAIGGSLDNTGLDVFTVTALEKSEGGRRGYHRGELVFKTDQLSWGCNKNAVVPATAEGIAAVKHAIKEWEACQDIIKAAEARRNKAREAIPFITAREYAALKVKP